MRKRKFLADNPFLGMEKVTLQTRDGTEQLLKIGDSTFLGTETCTDMKRVDIVHSALLESVPDNPFLGMENVLCQTQSAVVGMVNWNGAWVPSDCEFKKLKLALENAHPRDARIVFRDRDHVYFVDGEANYTSVTTVIKAAFPPFQADRIARAMCKRGLDQYPKYQSLCFEEDGSRVPTDEHVRRLKDFWTRNGNLAASLGTKLHNDIELYYNAEAYSNDSIEFGYFLKYDEAQRNLGLIPWRTEIIVFGEDERICGSVDMVFKDALGRYRLRDWKRSKEIEFKNAYNKHGLQLLSHLPDCNYEHYCLQLNLYKYLLERYYDMQIFDMALVVFHPNNAGFVEIEVAANSKNIMALLQMNNKTLEGS